VARDSNSAERAAIRCFMNGHILGLIPARAGSKGIPGKNLRPFCGRPLIAHAIHAAQQCPLIDRIVVSTDSEEIAAAARTFGADVPFLRPSAIAQDETPMVAVVDHCVDALERAGWQTAMVVLLQPTSPLRRPAHITRAVTLLCETGADSVVSIVPVPATHSPDYVMRIANGRLEPFLPESAKVMRRQDARTAYERDGTVYAFWRETLRRHGNIYGADCRPLELPAGESIALDTPADWEYGEYLCARLPTP
jgi:CMP-N,N'-diacetyllegionaminic acid synthase